jgi:uncharacterized protein YkwD
MSASPEPPAAPASMPKELKAPAKGARKAAVALSAVAVIFSLCFGYCARHAFWMVRDPSNFDEKVYFRWIGYTLGFLTVKPEPTSGETIELKFIVSDPAPDTDDEQRMLDLVNAERTKRDLPPLAMDATLRSLARSYALDLFARGYFSHTSKEGLSPFDRMRNAGVIYGMAGENLALAPTLEQAHDGLMKSPGHRANILNPGFRKICIGVLDGGVYGKMFVQEFTD